MSSVRRRINYTGRKRIPHERVKVDVMPPQVGKPLQASVVLKLEALDFPSSARIVFEAYQRSTAMRFDMGTIKHPTISESLLLSDLDPAASVLFRLKIVSDEKEEGRILGSAERLRPASDENEDGRKSLFPIDLRDLGPEIWKLEIGDASPRLLLNFSVPGFVDKVRMDPLVQGLLLPAALRGVLTELVQDAADDGEDEGTWKSEWLRFCREELRLAEDPSELATDEDREHWVADGVQRFCKNGEFLPRIRRATGEVE